MADVDIALSQRERLAYLELRLYFLGEVSRQDLMTRFGIAPAAATRDFAVYRDAAPENIQFESSRKTYVIGDNFFPAFEHFPERVLPALTMGIGDGVKPIQGALITSELPVPVNRPAMSILAVVTRAIHQKKALRLSYFSYTSGKSEREIVPFALISDGLRWHARGFDRKTRQFRDFVLTRMESPSLIKNEAIYSDETPEKDIQWQRIVELAFVPHPDKPRPEITIRDHGMKDGVLQLNARAAMVGYILQQWHVDCSPDHSIKDPAFRLWLKDHLTLYGVESAKFAPGYPIADGENTQKNK